MPITSSGFCCLTAHLRQGEGGGKAKGWQEGLSRAGVVGGGQRGVSAAGGREVWSGMVGEGRCQSATSPPAVGGPGWASQGEVVC